jgi:hypothetical protein
VGGTLGTKPRQKLIINCHFQFTINSTYGLESFTSSLNRTQLFVCVSSCQCSFWKGSIQVMP